MAYAWSEISLGEGKTIKLGDKVSADDVGGTEEFELLKSERVIRDQKYPDFIRNGEAPKRALMRRAREAMEAAERGLYEEHGPAIYNEDYDSGTEAESKKPSTGSKNS